MIRRHRRPTARTGGFTLVEVLVAMVVLSVGMLGIAGLYVTSLRSGRVAVLRTQAVTLAGDLAERIRANRGAVLQYDDGASGVGAIDPRCQQGGAGCTGVQMANHDKADWIAAVQQSLPAAATRVTVDPATDPDTITIVITWVEPSLGEDPQVYTTSFQV
jgi:type IV pilus assembly protein PilV